MSLTLVRPDSGTRVLAHSPPLVCSWTRDRPELAWVRLAGELELSGAPLLARTLRELRLQARVMVVDLRELELIDSFGVHAIVNAAIAAREVGHRLVLVRGRPSVDAKFTLAAQCAAVEIRGLRPAEPSVQLLLQHAEEEMAH